MIFTLVLEGLAMCLMLTMLCIIGTKDGAAGMAFFYEKPVQDKAIARADDCRNNKAQAEWIQADLVNTDDSVDYSFRVCV